MGRLFSRASDEPKGKDLKIPTSGFPQRKVPTSSPYRESLQVHNFQLGIYSPILECEQTAKSHQTSEKII